MKKLYETICILLITSTVLFSESVVPIKYKQVIYKGALDYEMFKANNYNIENGIHPRDPDRWFRSYPVLEDMLVSVDSIAEYCPKEQPDYIEPTGKYPVHIGVKRGSLLYRDQILVGSKTLSMVYDMLTHYYEHNCIDARTAIKLYFDNDKIIKHESYHAALEQSSTLIVKDKEIEDFIIYIARDYFEQQKNGRLIYLPEILLCHDLGIFELKNYLSQLQEYEFSIKGKRIESDADYDQVLASLHFNTAPYVSDFYKDIEQYPFDVKRMFLAMLKLRKDDIKIFNGLVKWQKWMLPGFF